MPDLTIKPNAGSGNKVIIQDQAGGAVMTTADSGATLGNSTQDNITRLGTVTTGNISNSAIVYPAGHVINTWHFSHSVSSSADVSLTTTFDVVVIDSQTMQITGITATQGNLLWMSGYGGAIRHNNDATHNTSVGFKIDGSEFRILQVFDYTQYVSTSSQCGFIYTVPAGFTNKTIQFCGEEQVNSPNVLMQLAAINGPNYMYMIIQEIQQ